MNIGGIWRNPGTNNSEERFDFSFGALGLALGPHARTFEDERYFLVLEGQIYDVQVEEVLPDISALETAYGHYCYVQFEKTTGRVDIGTDRLGYYPLYHALEDGRLVFGTSLNFVKSKLRKSTVNFDAWEELLVLGEIIGDKSTVKEIERLPPGTRISIENGKIRLVRFWSPELPDVVDDRTYILQNNALLEEAIALTSSQKRPKVVLLSGGEDSRRIALAASRIGLDVSFRSQQASHQGGFDIDTRIARVVAEALRRDIAVEPLPSCQQYVTDWQTRDSLLGFECITHEWLLPMVRSISPESIIYDGITAGVSINGHFIKMYPQSVERYRDTGFLARMICGEFKKPWLSELRSRTSGSLVERVESILAGYPESPHRLSWFYMLNHTRRKIALASQLFAQHGHWTCYPYMYYPLLLQSLSADPRQQRNRFFQRECMVAIAPEIAAIPTTRGVVPQKYLVSMKDEDRKQLRALRQQLRISDEALDVFPTLRTRYRVLNKMRFPVGYALLDHFGWFFEPVSRFSGFLEWLNINRG